MLASRSKSGLSEASNTKTPPPTSRVSKLSRPGSTKTDHDSPTLVEKSPGSVDSKPAIERRSPKIVTRISTTPDKQPRILKQSELQSQLTAAQEELKKAKERLAFVETEKIQVLEELKDAKRLADEANETLHDALVDQNIAEEASEIEKFRAIEAEQANIDGGQEKEEEWQKKLESIQNEQAINATKLCASNQELDRLKHELAKAVDAKNSAMSHAEDATNIAEINAEKVELLNREVSRLKSLLESELENRSKESAELIKKLEAEVLLLKAELEKSKAAEENLDNMEKVIKGLQEDVSNAKRAVLDASHLAEEWKRKAELLKVQVEEVNQSNKFKEESLSSLMEQLEINCALLQDKEAEIVSLEGKSRSLELDVTTNKEDFDVHSQQLDVAQKEACELRVTVEDLKSQLQTVETAKMEAVNNEKIASFKIESLSEERDRLTMEVESTKDEGEQVKKTMEDLASALHEASAVAREAQEKFSAKQVDMDDAQSQMGELKLTLKNSQEDFQVKLDQANNERVCLQKTVERLETEAKNCKDEWHAKKLNYVSSIKRSEEEITAIRLEVDKVVGSLSGTVSEVQVAKEDKTQLQNKLMQIETNAIGANKAAEEAKAEVSRLKERLLDKENELQNITQENDNLRIREAAAMEKISALSALLAEVTAKEAEGNGGHIDKEKESDLQKNPVNSLMDNGHEDEPEKPNSEVLKRKLDKFHKDDKHPEENGKITAKEEKEEETSMVESKMSESSRMIDYDLAKETDHDTESAEDELESHIDGSVADQKMNGLSSPTKKHQEQKKTPLLKKFGGLLKKRIHHK